MNLILRYAFVFFISLQPTLSEELYSKETVKREYFQTKTGQRSDKYRRNLGKLVVYYQEFNYEQIKEIEAYPVSIFYFIKHFMVPFDCQKFLQVYVQ